MNQSPCAERPLAPFEPPTQQPAPSGSWDIPPAHSGAVAAFLDVCEQDILHPGVVSERLRRAGWPAGMAFGVATQYRRRFNEHTLGYSALLVATGVAALAAGTAGHLLAAGIDAPVNRNALAVWLTIFICALPFALWAHRWAAKVDRIDPVAVWSGPRRKLANVLLWACGIVGVARLVIYAGQLIGVLVGASWAQDTSVVTGAVNVAITVGIALPLGLWSHGFLHRFDNEDPTVPVAHQRSATR